MTSSYHQFAHDQTLIIMFLSFKRYASDLNSTELGYVIVYHLVYFIASQPKPTPNSK